MKLSAAQSTWCTIRYVRMHMEASWLLLSTCSLILMCGCSVRWLSRGEVVKRLRDQYRALLDMLHSEADDGKNKKAEKLYNRMT